jgi:hypothetical protein
VRAAPRTRVDLRDERVYGPAPMPALPTLRAKGRPPRPMAEVDAEDLPLARLIREARPAGASRSTDGLHPLRWT